MNNERGTEKTQIALRMTQDPHVETVVCITTYVYQKPHTLSSNLYLPTPHKSLLELANTPKCATPLTQKTRNRPKMPRLTQAQNPSRVVTVSSTPPRHPTPNNHQTHDSHKAKLHKSRIVGGK